MTPDTEAVAERRVTRDVELAAVRDLLEQPPRGTVAFIDNDAVDLLPVVARFSSDRYLIAHSIDIAADLENREVILVVDDGQYWFELRGFSVRGVATRVDSEWPGGSSDLVWYAIEPRRVLAWDYGQVREE